LWTYTAYILWKFFEENPEKKYEVEFGDFADLIFNLMWQEENLVFHDGKLDLYNDIQYLHQLGVLDFRENEKIEKIRIKVKDIDKLNQVAKIVQDSFNLTGVDLLKDYRERIDNAVKRKKVPVTT